MVEQVKVKVKKNYTIFWIVGGCCLLLVVVVLVIIGVFYFFINKSDDGLSNIIPTNLLSPSASNIASKSSPSPTATANDRIYNNSKYGFSFEVPESWGEYQIEEKSDELGNNFLVYIKTEDQSFDSMKPGWAHPVSFAVYIKSKWEEVQSDPLMITAEQKITEKGNYVYTYSHWQDCAEDLCDKVNVQDIVDGFKVE